MTSGLITVRVPRAKRKESPLALLISIIRTGGRTREQTANMQVFRHHLLSPGYEELLDAVIEDWMRMKYSNAHRAAFPPSSQAIKKALAQERKQKERLHSIDKNVEILFAERLFNLIMPNNKPLHACTGAECKTFGSYYTKIGEMVGDEQLVSAVLKAEDLVSIIGTTE